jgi:hypothetical protein
VTAISAFIKGSGGKVPTPLAVALSTTPLSMRAHHPSAIAQCARTHEGAVAGRTRQLPPRRDQGSLRRVIRLGSGKQIGAIQTTAAAPTTTSVNSISPYQCQGAMRPNAGRGGRQQRGWQRGWQRAPQVVGGSAPGRNMRQWQPDQRSRRDNKKGSGAWCPFMPPCPRWHRPLAARPDRKHLTSSVPSAARAVAYSTGSGWACAWQESGVEAARSALAARK